MRPRIESSRPTRPGKGTSMTAPLVTRVMRAEGAAVDEAARLLAAGGLVAFPTETVYGLGADATNGEAVARLYAAKGRPSFNPLIALCGNRATGGDNPPSPA